MVEPINTCPIWGTSYEAEGTYDPENRVYDVKDSKRAFTGYKISEQMLDLVRQISNSKKAHLTTWLIDQFNRGNDQPEITLEVLLAIGHQQPLPVHARADRLLKLISVATRSEQLGIFVRFPRDWHYALAWSESTDRFDVNYLLDYLEKKGWLERDPLGPQIGQDVSWRVSVEGHTRVDELQSEENAPDSTQAFVAMWFDESMDDAFNRGIEPAVKNAGYKAFKISDKPDVDKIDDEIIGEIRRSRFLVADFTHGDGGARGSVYYEAGFAYGLGLPVVRSCRKDIVDRNELHFDVRQHYHVVWETPEELRDGLEKRIRALIGEGPEAHQAS